MKNKLKTTTDQKNLQTNKKLKAKKTGIHNFDLGIMGKIDREHL